MAGLRFAQLPWGHPTPSGRGCMAPRTPRAARPPYDPSVLDPARYLADFARFLANKDSQELADADALRELERVPLELPSGLELEWLGVSGYRITFEGHTLLVDPYVSRCSV